MEAVPISTDARMTALAQTFPTLRQADGVFPWDPERLAMWAYQYASSGGIYAAQFVLAVYHGRIGRVSGRRKTPKKDEWHGEHRFNLDTWWKCGPFDVVEAMSTWDDYHRAAFIAWVNKPWFP